VTPVKDSLADEIAVGPSKQERYDAALLDALDLLADRKLNEALTALAAAQTIQDTEQVQRLMAKVKGLIAQQTEAVTTLQNVHTVLKNGNAEDAARLSSAALQQYGGTEATDELARVQRQAEALVTAASDDAAGRRRRLQTDAEAALKDNNLRAAAISLEQALQLGDDPVRRRQFEEVRGRLTRYDDDLRRARELRRDPGRLEEALAALQDAGRAWDTLQVRQEIDDYTLALQKRRDRLSVADFEVRGNVGVPAAGKAVADELLPAFKSRFDLVERGHLGQVLNELRLTGPDLTADPQGRQEIGRLAGVRYLIVGSLTPMNGILLQARLVEVPTGLVMQTARLTAPSFDTLLPLLPQVAQMLQMTDEQKLTYELQQARYAPPVQPIAPAPLPPPPPPPGPSVAMPPPILTQTARPPDWGGLTIQDFGNLPPVVVVPPPAPPVLVAPQNPYHRRLFQISVELGDNLFRRGRFHDAHRHFQLALTLGVDSAAIQLRIDRFRPYLPPPPPPPVVIAPTPPLVVLPAPPPPPVIIAPPARPRIAVFNFLLQCDPGLVPASLCDWAADQFACYFGTGYQVIDRGEVCWYMGRLGITMRDVLNNPNARRCLAQALNARFFVFGAIQQTHSFDVTTHMLDAATGARTGTGAIHVQDHNELKLRMHELARQLGAAPAEQTKLAQKGKDTEKALNEARRLQKGGSFTQAAAVTRAALKQDPQNVALQAVQEETERQARRVALEEGRKRDEQARQAAQKAAEARQRELARRAEEERLRSEQEAKKRSEAARHQQEQQQQRAAEQLRTQARLALKKGDYTQAVQTLQSAAALKPSDDLFRELAQAKIESEKANRAHAAAEQAKRETEAKKQREAAQARVEEERRRQETEVLVRRKAQEERDQKEYARLIGQAQQQISKQQFEPALAAVQAARHLRQTEESDRLLRQIHDGQALTAARKQGEQERAEAERRLAEERKKREQAETEARRKQEAHTAALKQAQQALAAKRYDEAIAHYQEAGKLFRTDAVLSGQRQAEQLRDQERARRQAEQRRQAEAARTAERVKSLLADGQKALDARQFDGALKSFREASRLAPTDVNVRAALSRAEHAAEEMRQQNQRKQEQSKPKSPPAPAQRNPQAEYGKHMQSAAALEKQKKFAEAVRAYNEALRWQPKDARATVALRNAEFELHMAEGKKAQAAKRFAEAVKEYEEALKRTPTSAEAKTLLQRAREGKP
jgi:tetratricopeptide (TPR) repeat protein